MPTPPERPPQALATLQKRFADHIRDPDNRPAPEGIEERRLAIYRRLFFNNISGLFAKNFPIPYRIVPDDRWRKLIRAFMVEHRPTTPLFPEIGREFVRFLAEHPEHYPEWPWLAELAHWQFASTGVRNDEADLAALDVDPEGDLLAGHPVVNPTLRLAQYRWPVHRIRANRLPDGESPVILAIWRRTDDSLGRLQINALTGRLLELLQENPGSGGHDCLIRLAGEIDHSEPEALVGHGRDLLASLRDRDLIVGTDVAGHPA
ncbi:MAG: putative DNA-binding domain-containing protein [Wenzhouxiangellaceae bacterium]|nr:putative DNA-binding domain-containing protein [Wenzhouxiangellaceae bacterium]